MSTRSKRDKFHNYCHFVASHFDVMSDKEMFYQSNEMVLKCKRAGHEKPLKVTSIANKKYYLKDLDLWCDLCNREARYAFKTQSFATEVDEKVGHSIVSVDWSTRRVEYKCVNCGETRQNYVHNLKRKEATGRCDKCQNDDRRIPFSKLCEIVENCGKKLITTSDDYQNNKQKLQVVCECGQIYGARLVDIKRGKSCGQCLYDRQQQRSEATVMNAHGVRNVMQVPEVIEKVLKSGFTSKEFILPSGRSESVQGYEPQAITYLLGQGVSEDDMVLGKEKPRIPYQDTNGDVRTYWPDLFLREAQMVVEVKCLYTLLKEHALNRLKWIATVKSGFKFRLLLFDGKGVLDSDTECSTEQDVITLCDRF